MTQDQHIEIALINLLQTALAHGFAIGTVAVDSLMPGCHEPVHHGARRSF